MRHHIPAVMIQNFQMTKFCYDFAMKFDKKLLLAKIQRDGLSRPNGIKHIFGFNAPSNPDAQAAETLWASVKPEAAQRNFHKRQRKDLFDQVKV